IIRPRHLYGVNVGEPWWRCRSACSRTGGTAGAVPGQARLLTKMEGPEAPDSRNEWFSGWAPEAPLIKGRVVSCLQPAISESPPPGGSYPQHPPGGARSRATARPRAASAPGSSFQAVPPGAGLLRADPEPRDLPGPRPRCRQPWKMREAADRTCEQPRATAARPGPAGHRPVRLAGPP